MRPVLSTTAANFSITKNSSFRKRLAVSAFIFLLAFGVRVLSWHDTRLEVGKVQIAVTADYRRVADLLRAGGLGSFFSSSSPLADLNNLGHPPGYSILWATLGTSDTRIQFCQTICDALSAVMIFLIITELLPLGAGAIAGLLAACSPQFAWNSVLLLPDSLSVLPVLVAIFLIARATKQPRLPLFIIAGALIGLSCWLRANAMLLTFFVALAVPLLINDQRRVFSKWRFPLAVVAGTLLVILPLTIRNAVVFHRFIPLSLGAGQTLLEGIGDYDHEGQLGIPSTDVGIMKQEAESYRRPDYYGTLFNPDGVERERARLSRGFAVIRSHPLWFAGVMTRRTSSMVRLERARLISKEPPVSHSLDTTEQMTPLWSNSPADLKAGVVSTSAQAQTDPDNRWLALQCDNSKYNLQLRTSAVPVKPDTDYVFALPVKIERGRVVITVSDTRGKLQARYIIETREDKTPQDQPIQTITIPFVSGTENVQLSISNEAPAGQPFVRIGTIGLYDLGPARFLWTRYPRFVVHGIQKLFLTAVILPFAIIGLLVLIFQKQSRALVILSVVPVYFFLVQSIVHTEYRYVLAVDYFLFGFAGVAICLLGSLIKRYSLSLWERVRARA